MNKKIITISSVLIIIVLALLLIGLNKKTIKNNLETNITQTNNSNLNSTEIQISFDPKIKYQSYTEEMLSCAAFIDSNISYCNYKKGQIKMDCLDYFYLYNSIHIENYCNDISDFLTKSICVSIKNKDTNECNMINNVESKKITSLYGDVNKKTLITFCKGVSTFNENTCKLITDTEIQEVCITKATKLKALKLDNMNLCNSLNDEYEKRDCKALILKNTTLCK